VAGHKKLAFNPGRPPKPAATGRDQLILSIPSVRVKSPSPFGLRRTKATARSALGAGLPRRSLERSLKAKAELAAPKP
jgi:hypothetical protein